MPVEFQESICIPCLTVYCVCVYAYASARKTFFSFDRPTGRQMFIREKATKNGTLLQLVCSERLECGKVRQRIIVSLGGMRIPTAMRSEVAAAVERRLGSARQQELFPLPLELAVHVDEILSRINHQAARKAEDPKKTDEAVRLAPWVFPVPLSDPCVDGVLLDQVTHSRSVMLGPLLPLEAAWHSYGLDSFLSLHGLSQSQMNAAKACVYNRLCDPCSENALASWVQTTALSDLLSEPFSASYRDRYYRVGDKLLERKEKLEQHLVRRATAQFSLSRTILLYDLTNSYFEGQAELNELAARSQNSKEKRNDCPLLALGMVLDADGFPLCHKVFPGNTHDSQTLEGMVGELKKLSGLDKTPTVAMDSGLASKENIAWLVGSGYDYIVSGKRQSRQDFYTEYAESEEFTQIGGRSPEKAVLVRRTVRGEEQIVLCKSESRQLKEEAIISKSEQKFLEALEKLSKRIERGDGKLRLDKDDSVVNRALGTIFSKHTRASRFYEAHYEGGEPRRLVWARKDKEFEKAIEMCGCYFLRTNRMDLSDDEIWKVYMSLSRLEAAWRNMKSDLGLRPFYHQLDTRCEAHVLITVLAFHLQRWVEQKLENAGLRLTFRKVYRLLQTHCYATLCLPTKDGKMHSLRKPGRPDEKQAAVYAALGIDLGALPTAKLTTCEKGQRKKRV